MVTEISRFVSAISSKGNKITRYSTWAGANFTLVEDEPSVAVGARVVLTRNDDGYWNLLGVL